MPAMILFTQEVRHAPALAAIPAVLRVAPEGLGWFVAHVPIRPDLAIAAQAICAFSALAAIVGVRARPALAVLTVVTFYLFALSQLAGTVWHDMHLVWMSALLAASPCDEALAFDARGTRVPAPDARFGLPLSFARALLACVYFFPGFHKLATSGIAWALSDNLRNQLWWKWAEHGIVPALRIDRLPFVLHASGLFVVAFELSFPLLAFLPRTRPWAATMGIAFHVLAAYFFRIPFVSLWATYVVLVDPCPAVTRVWSLLRGPRKHAVRFAAGPPAEVPPARTAGVLLVGSALVLGALIQGVRGQMRSFPFACYPTFEWIVGTTMPDLRIVAVKDGGEEVEIPHGRSADGYRTQRQWGETFSLVGMWAPIDPARLRAYAVMTARQPAGRAAIAGAVAIRAYRAEVSVVPEERGLAPLGQRLLAEYPLRTTASPADPARAPAEATSAGGVP